MKATFKNYTPHTVRLMSDATTTVAEYPSLGVARVATKVADTDTEYVKTVAYGAVEGLPDPEEGTLYIVSALVRAASERKDLVSPATGPKEAFRNTEGQIIGVPYFYGN